MANIFILLWAVLPPLLLLLFYYRRTPAAPSLLRLFIFFIVGAVSGFVALGLEWFVHWQEIQRFFLGAALRQLLIIAPIEEGCKFLGVFIPLFFLQRIYNLRATTVFLFTITVALGFTAEENWIYLFHGTALPLERIIGTPVHAMFSVPWGYALGIYIASSRRLHKDRNLIFISWLNSVCSHALVNTLSSAWGFPRPIHFLGYGLFPFLLWMFWRLEQFLRRLKGKRHLILISGNTTLDRYWQRGLILLSLILGGNAILGLLILVRKVSPLRMEYWFKPDIFWFIIGQILLNLCLGILAWLIYRYLRYLAIRRSFFRLAKY
ncbi:PrsW family intramembrane metalloprotease [Sphaerospermopsis aphanizomenoides BCCUSP55]|uniref:PrsW family glutamic-type intramembrane protease n=1 Tax=Sphaerospermopsis aphanizomenoides TaxID=459663 RepID=UPI0019043C86|nr:PrsW family glutamic-type intramembrane protease [Sphaerospermopsis aphanizomenoides]MBK1989102.1 PrsW family intramembrane metalloprotease [Sphaerospermopsis aphanizomenoides BCCUSP55]